MRGRVLVVGGAGYVGSHCARRLKTEGFDVETLDDLSTGHAEAVTGPLHRVDLRDATGVAQIVARGFDAVLHFAAMLNVGDSVADPLTFFDVNVRGTITLLQAMRQHGCDGLVFSSTCAVYGVPAVVPIAEDTPHAPINPYGQSKAMVEAILAESARVHELRPISLRYFNAAGASLDNTLGEAHRPETHLIPLAIAAAREGRTMKVFGDDFPTPDGTCIRDYVHVEDLAEAHLLAVERLLAGGTGGAWNLGTGEGYSVLEVLDAVERATGCPLKREITKRRAGDPPRLVGDPTAAARDLGWTAGHDIDVIAQSATRWADAPRY